MPDDSAASIALASREAFYKEADRAIESKIVQDVMYGNKTSTESCLQQSTLCTYLESHAILHFCEQLRLGLVGPDRLQIVSGGLDERHELNR